ncbi:hypothetical protein ACFL0D_02115 [Thermoproteota archaeon]
MSVPTGPSRKDLCNPKSQTFVDNHLKKQPDQSSHKMSLCLQRKKGDRQQ